MAETDVFTEMINEELRQHRRYFIPKERKLYDEKKYRELARTSLRSTRLAGAGIVFLIIILSVFSMFYFSRYGNSGEWIHLGLGILSWFSVITGTIFYMRYIVEKKKCMMRVNKLIEAREKFKEKSG